MSFSTESAKSGQSLTACSRTYPRVGSPQRATLGTGSKGLRSDGKQNPSAEGFPCIALPRSFRLHDVNDIRALPDVLGLIRLVGPRSPHLTGFPPQGFCLAVGVGA